MKRPRITLGHLACIAFIALTTLVRPGLAQEEKTSPSTKKEICSAPGRTGLRKLACGLASELNLGATESVIVSAEVEGAPTAKAGREIARRLSRVVAATLGDQARAASRTSALGSAPGLAGTAGTLVHLQPKINGATLEVVGDVFKVPKNFWARARDPRPLSIGHAFVSQPLDAELRSFFPTVPIAVGTVDKAKHSTHSPVALACGDVDSDRSLELLIVGRHEISLGRVESGAFRRTAAATWRSLSPVATSPARQPMGSALITPGHVWVGLSDRAHAVRLDAALRSSGKLRRLLPWAPEGCASVDSMSIQPRLSLCVGDGPAPLQKAFSESLHAIAGASLSQPDGTLRSVRAAIEDSENRLRAVDSHGASVSIKGVGAQVAVGDLDGDGQPELITSRSTLDPKRDAVDVRTWSSSGKLVMRFSLPVPAGVSALAVCPAEDLGLAPLAIATPHEIWIVR